MFDYDTKQLEKSCRQLMADLGKALTWKWDSRFETVLAEFNVADKEKIHPLLARHMNRTWGEETAAEAPEAVQVVMNYFGGLTPGQTLLTSDPDQGGLLLCAWWPWGNGKTISIRLAVFDNALSDDDNEALTRLFRGWFGL